MPYGTVKVDNITFDNGGADQNVTTSGIHRAITSGVTVSGTISGAVIIGGTSVSGTAVRGTTVTGTTVQGVSGTFTTLTGVTTTGTTANFASGVFTTRISGLTVTGTTAQFTSGTFVSLTGTTVTGTTINAGTVNSTTGTFTSLTGTTITGVTVQGTTVVATTGNFTSLTGITTTGTTANFTSGVFTTQVSGLTVTGTQSSFTSGNFVTLSGNAVQGNTGTFTSGIFALGLSVANPSISFINDPDTGIFSPGADQLGITTGGSLALTLLSGGQMLTGHDASITVATPGGVLINPRYQQQATTTANAALNANVWAANTSHSTLVLGKSRGASVGTHAILPINDNIGYLNFAASDGAKFGSAAWIGGFADAATSLDSTPGRLVFATSASGSNSPTERMRIRSDGNIGIGGAGNKAVTLFNQGPITGATTAYANFTSTTIQSDVTLAALGYRTNLATAAASFNLTSLQHFSALQATIGAGSTVTNQYGFLADNSLTGATNNYGFYSNLASATGRWNFYALGTAPNYFAGDVGIGTTSITEKLTVNGNVQATSNFLLTSTAAALRSTVGTGYVGVSGGTSVSLGGNVLCYGESDPTLPNEVRIRQGTTTRMRIATTGLIDITAGGTNQNITLTPTGTGTVNAPTFNATSTTLGGFQGIAADNATVPSFTFSGDLNTGMFRAGANNLGFTAGGSEVVRVNGAGPSGRTRQIQFVGASTITTSTGNCTYESANATFIEGAGSVRSETIRDSTVANAANVFINATSGVLSRSTSSIKYKTEVEEAESSFSETLVYQSEPVWYRSLCENDPKEWSYWGFIAEEVAQLDPRMVHWGDDGPESVQYDRYVVHLVKVAQMQKALIESLEARITALEAA